MKKLLLLSFVLILCFTAFGCEKQKDQTIVMSAFSLNQKIKGWGTYTNPQFRYELRHPQDWNVYTNNEGASEVVIYPDEKFLSDSYKGSIEILGYVNWKTQFDLSQYFQQQAQKDLFEYGYKKKTITLKDHEGVWFHDVDGLYPNDPEKTVDVIVFDMKDRIVEIHILEELDTAKIIFNSLNFYNNNVPINQPLDI